MTYYLVLREPGAAWNSELDMRKQERWQEHATFMDALADDGFIVLGGPIGDGRRFAHVVAAGHQEEIEQRFAHDPWTDMGLLRIAAIEPWDVLLLHPALRPG